MSYHSIQEPEPAVNRFRCGDVREDGKIFWSYNRSCKKGEYWVTPEDFAVFRERAKKYKYVVNREKRAAQRKAWREVNPGREAAGLKRWREKNRERVALYYKRRRDGDPTFALAGRIRCRVGAFIKSRGIRPSARTSEMVGCSWKELRSHIEGQFAAGMSWGNGGEWHIDHIVPLVLAKTERDVIELSHYSNLRPMWKHDNLRKHASPPSREEAPPQLWRFLPPSST